MTNIAFLIIDMQEAMFCNPENQPYKGPEVLKNVGLLLKSAREHRIPVVFVQQTSGGEFREGSQSWKICSALAPQPREAVVPKAMPNGFYRTVLDETLKRNGIDGLVVAGMQSEFCVKATCKGALCRGYHVTLVSDAHTTFSRPLLSAEKLVEKTNLILSRKGAALLSTDEILRHWSAEEG